VETPEGLKIFNGESKSKLEDKHDQRELSDQTYEFIKNILEEEET